MSGEMDLLLYCFWPRIHVANNEVSAGTLTKIAKLTKDKFSLSGCYRQSKKTAKTHEQMNPCDYCNKLTQHVQKSLSDAIY